MSAQARSQKIIDVFVVVRKSQNESLFCFDVTIPLLYNRYTLSEIF